MFLHHLLLSSCASLAVVLASTDTYRRAQYDGGRFSLETGDQFFLGQSTTHPRPGPPPDRSNQTIYQRLTTDPEYSKLSKVLNISEGIVSLLNDSSSSVTFFAVPDRALRHARSHHKERFLPLILSSEAAAANDLALYDLSDIVELVEGFSQVSSTSEVGDEKHKQIIRRIVRAVLAYHIIPSAINIAEIASNITLPTNLSYSGVIDGEPQRIKIEHNVFPPTTKINLNSYVVKSDINTTNGLIHVISRPLIPPPPAFQELFLLPSLFSIATTAVQRTNLTSAMDLLYSRKEKTMVGTSSVTVFAPSNRAFERLPHRLKLYLFSPFGQRVLEKLLRLHVAPDLVLHSDYLHNATSGIGPVQFEELNTLPPSFSVSVSPTGELPLFSNSRRGFEGKLDKVTVNHGTLHEEPVCNYGIRAVENYETPSSTGKSYVRPRLISAYNITVPTLLADHSLEVVVAKYDVSPPIPIPHKGKNIVTRMYVNGQVVATSDIPGANGAIHVVGRLISPRRHPRSVERRANGESPGDDTDWEDWEDWLLEWADIQD